jgi:hypothetical protein
VDKREQVAFGVTYGQGAIRRRCQFPRRANDPVKCCVEIQTCADLDEDVEQALHLVARRQQLVELLVHPANQLTLAKPSKSRAALVAGHPIRYLHDGFSGLATCVRQNDKHEVSNASASGEPNPFLSGAQYQ